MASTKENTVHRREDLFRTFHMMSGSFVILCLYVHVHLSSQRWVHHFSNTALEIYTFHHLINFIVNAFFSNQSVHKEFISSSTNTDKFSRMVRIYLDLLYISSLNRRYVYRCYALSQILQANLQQYHHPVTNPCDRLGDFQPFDHLDLIHEGTRKPGMSTHWFLHAFLGSWYTRVGCYGVNRRQVSKTT